jgi:Zn-dependent M16 (insulinase) family peptidase
MSRLIPDFEPLEINTYFHRPNTAFQAEPPIQEPPLPLTEFKEYIRQFSLNFTEEDRRKFKHASLTTKTTNNPRDTEHIWNTIRDFMVQSIKDTYPKSDNSVSLLALESAKITQFTQNNIDNVSIVLYLLGIVDGLL